MIHDDFFNINKSQTIFVHLYHENIFLPISTKIRVLPAEILLTYLQPILLLYQNTNAK